MDRPEELTLRDYFAGQALVGLIANKEYISVDPGSGGDGEWCYAVAEEMLAARGRVAPGPTSDMEGET